MIDLHAVSVTTDDRVTRQPAIQYSSCVVPRVLEGNTMRKLPCRPKLRKVHPMRIRAPPLAPKQSSRLTRQRKHAIAPARHSSPLVADGWNKIVRSRQLAC
jgi:hypothetical protein